LKALPGLAARGGNVASALRAGAAALQLMHGAREASAASQEQRSAFAGSAGGGVLGGLGGLAERATEVLPRLHALAAYSSYAWLAPLLPPVWSQVSALALTHAGEHSTPLPYP
jgi:hypothetical protein